MTELYYALIHCYRGSIKKLILFCVCSGTSKNTLILSICPLSKARLYCHYCRVVHQKLSSIRESVDSLCRDDPDMPMPPYIGKACNRANAAFVSLFR